MSIQLDIALLEITGKSRLISLESTDSSTVSHKNSQTPRKACDNAGVIAEAKQEAS